jgi:hypothetical protein
VESEKLKKKIVKENLVKMNCVSVQQENYKREKEKRSHSAGNNTTSRTFKSCLRGEIEDAESKCC